ncbi:MAG: sugar phosphate isomerase/epimerase [Anaerolineae bacterium]|jgi:sugar phosphate isomerase/epimerase|nr:sugar phosphate isomerase/epimerase [Anaerolineae bacterium]MDH7475282.1 sugar phosphate isomerase/epimerase [Anaerolineae bacterium]
MHFGARAHSLDDIEFLAESDFEFAEIDWKAPRLVSQRLAELAILRDKYGIIYLAHGPNERSPFDLDEIVEVMGPTVCQLLALAPALGITLHTQHLWLDPRFMSAEAIARKLDLLEMWMEHAARAGVTLCIENLSEHADHFAPAFQRLPELYMTLDLGHGEILSQPNAAFDFIARFPERIRHVHLHDNRGGNEVKDDLHLPIGQGQIDFAAILHQLRAAGYDGGFSFEIKLEHVEQSRDVIRELWDSASRCDALLGNEEVVE